MSFTLSNKPRSSSCRGVGSNSCDGSTAASCSSSLRCSRVTFFGVIAFTVTSRSPRPQNRQLAVKEISPSADLVIVVGSRNSSNSVRLVEVALEAGAKASYLVDDHTEIDEAWLDGVETVSVTSGASVPEDLVEGVLAFLSERGYPDAKAVHSAEESLIFALPPELRAAFRAAQKV